MMRRTAMGFKTPPMNRERVSRSTWVLLGLLLVTIAAAGTQYGLWSRTSGQGEHDHCEGEGAIRMLAAQLAGTPGRERVPLLVRLVANGNPGMRYAAVDALGNERGAEAANAIERAFRDSASLARQRAVEVLPQVDRERGLRLLLAALRDEDAWIREAAASQFVIYAGKRRTFVDRRAVPMLIQAIEDPDPALPVMAMSALRKLTGKPWRVKTTATAEQKRAIVLQWRRWWSQARSGWHIPSEYADVPPIRPARADPAPDFRFADIEGRAVRLSDQRGRLTLLNFWDTTAAPCEKEIAGLVQLDRMYRSRGLDILGIAGEAAGAKEVRRWCRQHGVAYRQALATADVQASFGLGHEVPVSVLIDTRGRVRYRWDGERDPGTLQLAIERLLQEQQM
jgi:peroxiredoxin